MKKGTKEWVEENKGPSPEEKELRGRISTLEEANARLSKQLGLVESYRDAVGKAPEWLLPRKKHAPQAATACLQFSDWHLDEVVRPEEVNGLNAYSRQIALLRLRRWAEKAVEMGQRHKHKWEGCLLIANGDDLSGDIHEELAESNESALSETILFWAPHVAAAVRAVADEYGPTHIEELVGNHGRFWKKKRFKGRARANWDYLLWKLVESHFTNDPRVTFNFAGASYRFAQVYDRHIFITHGDEVGGGGGWAGVWSPLGTIQKRAMGLAQAHGLKVSYCVVGHWHQTVLAHQRGLVNNGSGKGYDEFAAGLRFQPEAPMQNWWVETPEHGVTLAAPLFISDRKREGW